MDAVRDRALLIAVGVGAGLGVFSVLADGILPGRLFGILGNIAAPWGLAAFLVGHRSTSWKRGALAGGLTLVVGVAVYYISVAARGYQANGANLVWMMIAFVAGPVMGLSGAAVKSRPTRPPVWAVAAPSAMLVAEAIFLAIDSRVWRWTLGAEPYRLIDLGVMLALLLGGLALPFVFEKDRHPRGVVYLIVVLARRRRSVWVRGAAGAHRASRVAEPVAPTGRDTVWVRGRSRAGARCRRSSQPPPR